MVLKWAFALISFLWFQINVVEFVIFVKCNLCDLICNNNRSESVDSKTIKQSNESSVGSWLGRRRKPLKIVTLCRKQKFDCTCEMWNAYSTKNNQMIPIAKKKTQSLDAIGRLECFVNDFVSVFFFFFPSFERSKYSEMSFNTNRDSIRKPFDDLSSLHLFVDCIYFAIHNDHLEWKCARGVLCAHCRH